MLKIIAVRVIKSLALPHAFSFQHGAS